MQGMQQKLEKFCFRCKKNRCMSNQIIFYSLQSIWLLSLLIGLDT